MESVCFLEVSVIYRTIRRHIPEDSYLQLLHVPLSLFNSSFLNISFVIVSHYRVQKGLSLAPILSQMNPSPHTPIHSNIVPPPTPRSLSFRSFLQPFLPELCRQFSPKRATFPVHPILLELVILIKPTFNASYHE
jgi:hypothetical protein